MDAVKKELILAREEILHQAPKQLDQTGNLIVSLKVESEDEVFSTYNFDQDHELDSEFTNFLWKKTNKVQKSNLIELKLYTTKNLNKKKITNAIHNHYKEECIEFRNQEINKWLFGCVSFCIGLLALMIMFISYFSFHSIYVETIFLIVMWIGIWKGVDAFIEAVRIRKKEWHCTSLYRCTVKILKKTKRQMVTLQQKGLDKINKKRLSYYI